jgi:hypothetical protein
MVHAFLESGEKTAVIASRRFFLNAVVKPLVSQERRRKFSGQSVVNGE